MASIEKDTPVPTLAATGPNPKPGSSSSNKDFTTSEKRYDVDIESQDDNVGKLRSDHTGTAKPGDVEDEQGRPTITMREIWEKKSFTLFYRKFRVFFHVAYAVAMTAWWIYGPLIKKREGNGWLVPTLVYLAIIIRLITYYIPVSLVMRPVKWLWNNTMVRATGLIPSKLRQPIAAVGTLAVFLVGTMVPEETGDNTRGNRAVSIFGLIVMIVLLTVTSHNWRAIPWHTVIGGMLSQFIIAVFVLRTEAGYDIFSFISGLARSLLSFAEAGTEFLTAKSVVDLHWFISGVVPPIIFFIALVQLLYYVGFLQWFIKKFATFFFWSLKVSGAEAVVAAATPFIGQGESAMLIKPFIPHLTNAEIHQVMTCGFATIAGSVLVAYMSLGLNAQALVSSCIMSIPASLAVSKMRYPETEETLTSGQVVIPEEDEEDKPINALHAFANGAWLGIKIGGMIIATLLCIIAFVALIDGVLGWYGGFWDRPEFSLTWILARVPLYPVAWLLGVPTENLLQVGELIATKIIKNEYVAFTMLSGEERYTSMSPRARLIALYACCGFGNIGSLGTQIGVLSQLSPGRAGDVSRLAVSALFSGVLATLTSASVAGMLMTENMMLDMISGKSG
ncbi:Na+ dependent nucleoside transporter C-terminus-domain-containing protein [Rhypophila decipiens]|uniref:Na+ dependent nucleoside transporter C-terminus-domain-containing protein n=1 Tax=Rhypophila decipiens TaxID=261697 RepID=A0AAN6Y1Q4_9PEZI|nr:Na+ dependent nucleoside transporter C-terminus-domain-containing protein [Rhypophila decipiens]